MDKTHWCQKTDGYINVLEVGDTASKITRLTVHSGFVVHIVSLVL